MKALLVCILYMLFSVLAYPTEVPADDKYCIHLTPDKEIEINIITQKISNFLNDLLMEHEDFDITHIKVDLEEHSEDEEEEKETVFQLSVNNCADTDEETRKEKLEGTGEVEERGAPDGDAKAPEIMELFLAKNGEKMLKQYERNRGKVSPLLLYLQMQNGEEQYIFLN